MSNFMGGPCCTREELQRAERFKQMTSGLSPTPLMELFGAIAVPLCKHPDHVHMRVWHNLDGWHASWGTAGSVGGVGATPEDAILQAHANYIRLRDHQELRERVRKVKKESRSAAKKRRRK